MDKWVVVGVICVLKGGKMREVCGNKKGAGDWMWGCVRA